MIQCPACKAVNEATVNNREEEYPYLGRDPIKVVVPVWECNLCGETWTDHDADVARDAAIYDAVSLGNPRNQKLSG